MVGTAYYGTEWYKIALISAAWDSTKMVYVVVGAYTPISGNYVIKWISRIWGPYLEEIAALR